MEIILHGHFEISRVYSAMLPHREPRRVLFETH